MSELNPFILLKERRFLPLFCTQFLGAYNDNLFKNALIILIAFSATSTAQNTDTLINVCAGLFIVPFFIFSAMAGQLADKYEKAKLIRYIKFAEICLVILASLGFYFDNLWILMTSLFLLGAQATFFGPIKYSILPQHLHESELLNGNGLIEMGTFMAILLGTISGGILIALQSAGPEWVSAALILVALLGFASSLFIPRATAYVPGLKLNWNPWNQTVDIVRAAFQNRVVFHSIIGVSWFWMYGSLFIIQIANYTKLILGGNEHVVTLLLTTFSVGIGVGSVLCAKLSHKKVEMGLVLLGSMGLSIFACDLSFANSPLPKTMLDVNEFLQYGQNWRIIFDAFWMGAFGGFYVVPLYTLLQIRSKPEKRSRVIAANNILNALGMTIASLFAIFFLNNGFTIPELFLCTSILNAVVAVYLCTFVREFLTGFIAWIRNFYRK